MNASMTGASYEGLMGGDELSVLTANVMLDSDTAVEPGVLLAGSIDGTTTTVHWATASDATLVTSLFIAAEESAAGTTTHVATAYTRGRFNRGALKLREGVELKAFEAELRRQNIELTEEI